MLHGYVGVLLDIGFATNHQLVTSMLPTFSEKDCR